MFALVDCNSFFCAVERVFHPGLKHKPVVVLSNNDGIIVALTPEAKALGLHRGDPLFKVRHIVEQNKVAVFSTNMPLYVAMSKRIVNILRASVAKVEVYSIDESFCDLSGYERYYNLEDYMREVSKRIGLWTDIPVSVGIAPTKTLAKIGSKFAKQYAGYRGVCVIDTEAKRRKALELFDLADVWGIGRHTLQKLNYHGVTTPLEFADKSEAWVRNVLTKPGYQTWRELNGHSCIETEEIREKQTICVSRSFGNMVSGLQSLRSSVAQFAAQCASQLRAQESGAMRVTVFISSNRFREDLEQYGNDASVDLLVPTADTIEITEAAMKALQQIYREGIQYKKSGVVLSNIRRMNGVQTDLFDTVSNRKERADLMKAIDKINSKYGRRTIGLSVEGEAQQAWTPKREHEGNYLGGVDELLNISN